ncbi:transcriptional regulator, partial [Escherichia coli]
ERCPAIEKATGGAVTCEELRPDIDWAYLRGAAMRKLNVTASNL